MIGKLLLSVALLANPDFGLVLKVGAMDDSAAKLGTSPVRINGFESYESHGVSGTIETEMSASAGLAKAVLTSNENGSPTVAFSGAISLSVNIPLECLC